MKTANLEPAAADLPAELVINEQDLWDVLETCYDPEIPVNIVELGLIYDCALYPLAPASPNADNRQKAVITMTLTAPGCSMSDILRDDIIAKLKQLPSIEEVEVNIVFDPPWDPSMMSEAARLELGFF